MLKLFRWTMVPCLWAFAGCGPVAEGDVAPVDPEAPLSTQIEQFAGAPAKIVWVQSQDPDKPDTYVNTKSHFLMGLDTRDGKGPRVILKEKSNYARPMVTPDGEHIVYSFKDIKRKGKAKYFDVTIYRVEWDGTNIVKLAEGYAVDVWRDPRTGEDWVYAATDFQPKSTASIFAKKIVRFPLNDPEKVELVWDQTVVTPDSFQLSGDGLRACGLFPWPSAGAVDFTKGEWMKYARGCWPSCAPDNSYVTWVFEGGHKVLHFFKDGGKHSWQVDVSRVEGIDGHELYHPRWSNHVRYFAFTGPYKEGDPGENKISAGGRDADLFLARFNQRLNEVEASLRITKDKQGDFFPDLWIDTGEKKVSVSVAKVGPDAAGTGDVAVEEPEASGWPSSPERLVYLWENFSEKNEIKVGDRPVICGVEPRERARFFRNHEMNTGGGHFFVDEDSAARVEAAGKGPFVLEVLLTSDAEQDGSIVAFPGGYLSQQGASLVFAAGGDTGSRAREVGRLKAGEPVHVALEFTGDKWEVFVDGEKREGAEVEPGVGISREKGLVFGGEWEGKIMGVALYSGSLGAEAIGAHHRYWRDRVSARAPVSRVRVRGRLVEMTPTPSVESLDTYRRALVAYTYEVEEVLEGKCDEKRLQVMHWVIMDRQVLDSFPRTAGETYELELESFEAHPQLISERQFNTSVEFDLNLYYDIATPAP